MRDLELFRILTNVKSEYILEAQALRTGEKKAPIRLHRKRMLLIAAIISLLLLLVGCAAVLFAIQKISLGRATFPQYYGEDWTMDVVSTNGYQDSANYRATKEWLDFTAAYDSDGSKQYNWDPKVYTAPLAYNDYNCYTPELKDKVDEICKKYGLSLCGPQYYDLSPEKYLSSVGVSLNNPQSRDPLSLSDGILYYENGSFFTSGTVSHRFAGRANADSIRFEYTCRSKGAFFPDFLPVADIDSADSWEYTAWDGAQLILIQEPAQGIITTDMGNYFLSIRLNFTYGGPGGDVTIQNPCDRGEFERIADAFAYNLSPKPVEDALLQNADGVDYVYEDYYSQWLPGSLGSSAYDPYLKDRKLDLNGDGRRELLLWNERTAVIYEVYTPVLGDGIHHCMAPGQFYPIRSRILCTFAKEIFWSGTAAMPRENS